MAHDHSARALGPARRSGPPDPVRRRMPKPTIPARLARVRLLAAATLLSAASAGAQTANFDGLPTGNFLDIPAGYASHDWYYSAGTAANFGSGAALQYSSNIGCQSAPSCAYNAAQDNGMMRIESIGTGAANAFTFSGFALAGYPGFGSAATTVQVAGFTFDGTSFVSAFTPFAVDVSDGLWHSITTGSTGVNRLLLTPQTAAGGAGYLRLDDVTFGTPTGQPSQSVAPEPASLALLAPGLALLGLAVRRRRARQG